MENSLKKLTVQEKKYSGELDEAIAEYEVLKVQSADVDPVELYNVRHEIRPEYEQAVQEKFAEILGKEPTVNVVFNARYSTNKLLNIEEEERIARRQIRQRQRVQRTDESRKSREKTGWER